MSKSHTEYNKYGPKHGLNFTQHYYSFNKSPLTANGEHRFTLETKIRTKLTGQKRGIRAQVPEPINESDFSEEAPGENFVHSSWQTALRANLLLYAILLGAYCVL